MTWFLEGAAIVCLLYYAVIAVYSGLGTSFSLFWPFLAAFFLCLAVGWKIYERKKDLIPLWIPVSLGTVLAACGLIFLITELCIVWGAVTARAEAADYVIVLGAKAEDGEPGNSLKTRLDRAVSYSVKHPNTVLILSGGKGGDESVSEARVMYDYLKERGVLTERMLLEDQSSSTAENILFSCKVIERQEYYKDQMARVHLREQYHARSEWDEVRVAVLTDNYHQFRARAIAKKQGIANPAGIAASGDPVLAVHMWIREGFAVLKDKFMGKM